MLPGQKRPSSERERKAQLDHMRPAPAQRGYDGAWQAVRAAFLAANPVCESCGAQATEADHRLSVRDRPDLRLAWDNLQALCKSCHSRRTAREQGFARR